MSRVAIIGAGWAGLTAALSLQAQGCHVTLYERSPAKWGAGGRASTVYPAGEKAPFALDNGQHVLLGAYTDTLTILKTLGINMDTAFLRVPAAWYMPHTLKIILPTWGDATKPRGLWAKGWLKRLPLILALLNATTYEHHCAITPRFLTRLARLMAALRLYLYRPKHQETVNEWLKRLSFPAPFDAGLWQPLCYATLNTPPNIASAKVFKRVIQDGLLSGSYCAAMLVPRIDLGAMFPILAVKKLQRGGAIVHLGCSVDSVSFNTQGLPYVKAASKSNVFDQVICATTAKDAYRILPTECIRSTLSSSYTLNYFSQQTSHPITTIHLQLSTATKGHILKAAVLILPDPTDSNQNTQALHNAVLIDRSYLDATQSGWLTLVLSCSQQTLSPSNSDWIHAAKLRLGQVFPDLIKVSVLNGIVIHAKQATFSCTADLVPPSCRTTSHRLVLAGDYLTDYPATLEAAVKSGLRAATIVSQRQAQ
jgi:hydroxysqualene dehydroxylase